MYVKNITKKTTLAENAKICENIFSRTLGLMFSKPRPLIFIFEKEKINGKAIHESLFELERIKRIIKQAKKPKIVFLFKTLDSLEMLEDDYSKKLLLEITPLVDMVVVSFATRSMISRKKFKVNRNWIVNFIKENFKLVDDFELGGERYIVFKK